MKTLLVLTVLVAVAAGLVLPEVRSALSCQMCELVVKKYDASADKDVNAIKKDFDAECKKLFHTIPFGTAECDHYVNKKIDPIIHELESGTAPKDVCTKLNECP
uniref:Saposin B-type domain-containing protein n=1 Tax=Caenorhabditis tropicalis TaxID=1561998 RepID=A0A1I7TWJ0_9PELO